MFCHQRATAFFFFGKHIFFFRPRGKIIQRLTGRGRRDQKLPPGRMSADVYERESGGVGVEKCEMNYRPRVLFRPEST